MLLFLGLTFGLAALVKIPVDRSHTGCYTQYPVFLVPSIEVEKLMEDFIG